MLVDCNQNSTSDKNKECDNNTDTTNGHTRRSWSVGIGLKYRGIQILWPSDRNENGIGQLGSSRNWCSNEPREAICGLSNQGVQNTGMHGSRIWDNFHCSSEIQIEIEIFSTDGGLTYWYYQVTKLTTSAVTWEVPDNCTLSCWLYNESVWNDDTSLIACPSCSMERAKLSNSASVLFNWALLKILSGSNSRVAFLKWIPFSLIQVFLHHSLQLRYPSCWGNNGICYIFSIGLCIWLPVI